MNDYRKPVIAAIDELAEGVYAASGSAAAESSNAGENAVKRCRFGRTAYNPGSDTCQGCSASGGASDNGSGKFQGDFTGCPDNMPSV